mmetsp:Transcript_15592/g.18120  ORF Transcript_15592/g.18120 Transcript_15592/m.18120 type:complete len:348 (+) Transcript_15592:189-1232(+)
MSNIRHVLMPMARRCPNTAASNILRTTLSATSLSISNSTMNTTHHQYRFQSAKSKTKMSLKDFNNEKSAAKQRRKEIHDAKIERRSSLPQRRDKEKKNHNNKVFRSWFDKLTEQQAYLDREARRQGLPWKIKVAVMIERLPVVTPDMEDWELDYMYLRAELDRYGIQYPKELGMDDPMETEVLTVEELYALLPEGYTPAPRETLADSAGDIQTLERRLKTRVYLSIRPDDATGWTLPNAVLNENETLLEAAKRAVTDVVGDNLKILCLSNCPMTVDMIPYSSEERNKESDFFGEKIFFMRIQYEDGDVSKEMMGKMDDWGWLERSEMSDKVKAEKGEDAGFFYKYML